MLTKKSAGAIIFHKKNNKTYYLVLQYPINKVGSKKEYWGFAKGGIEKNETLKQTAAREIQEETSLKNFKFIDGFKEIEKYFFTEKNKKIFKMVVYLLAETNTEKVKISDEHIDSQWLCYEDAFKKLTFKNARNLLEKANKVVLNQKPL